MQENAEKIEARKKERKARREPEERLYELTLKQADLPGLPPPVAKTNDLTNAGKLNGTNNSPPPDAGTQDVSRAESRKDASDDDDDDVAPEDKVTPVDVTMKETKRILLDLIALSTRETAVAVHD